VADDRRIAIEGGVVTRPAHAGTPTVHAYLRHLRDQGVHEVPEPLGIADGLETLRYVEGASGGEGWHHQHDDRGLSSAARLLRRVHDVGSGWTPPDDAVWGAAPVPADDPVFCHGDPGPWNYVWHDQEAVALLDWDFLHPGPRVDDVAYALRWFAPLRDDEHALEWHHFPAVPDRRARVETFLATYGDLPPFDVAAEAVAVMRRTRDRMAELAAQGVEPQRTWVAEGALDDEAQEIAWVLDHRHLVD
jgi:aminoglycoside phosphotransferase (APT) family kinase protein